MNPAQLALMALLPLATGPLPGEAKAGMMTVSVCSGSGTRTVEMPIPGKGPDLPEPCVAKACHAGCNRKPIGAV